MYDGLMQPMRPAMLSISMGQKSRNKQDAIQAKEVESNRYRIYSLFVIVCYYLVASDKGHHQARPLFCNLNLNHHLPVLVKAIFLTLPKSSVSASWNVTVTSHTNDR